jgi:hypothetical protein
MGIGCARLAGNDLLNAAIVPLRAVEIKKAG